MKKINLEEIALAHIKFDDNLDSFIVAMKEACRQALELAAERAVLTHYIDGNISPRSKSIINLNNGAENTGESIGVNKQSILDTINQIE